MAKLATENDSTLYAEDISQILSGLSLAAQGLYYFMPDECWMTEKTMAEALHTHPKVIRDAKQELEEAGLVYILRESDNFNNKKTIHRVIKVEYVGLLLILDEYDWVLRARERVLTTAPQETQQLETENILPVRNTENISPTSPVEVPMNWELLNEYSAAEVNQMTRLEQAELYMTVGFLVLPTNYPIFSDTGEVSCSCKNVDCHAIGKHPAVKSFKDLTPDTYQKRRSNYLQRFKQNPKLNIGFKVFGYSVLDVDFDKGGSFSLGLLREEIPGLDETLTAATANGLHLYSSTIGLNQSVSFVGEGLDIRSDKTSGFIVAPCSLHKSGKQYQWHAINDLQPIPDEWLYGNDEPEVDKPEGTKQGRVSKKTGKSLDGVKIPNPIPEGYRIPVGERAVTLFKFACRERGRGAGANHIYDVLVTIRDTYCDKSKDKKEEIANAQLRSIAKDVARRYPTNAEKLEMSKVA
jgi:hypothetical protein